MEAAQGPEVMSANVHQGELFSFTSEPCCRSQGQSPVQNQLSSELWERPPRGCWARSVICCVNVSRGHGYIWTLCLRWDIGWEARVNTEDETCWRSVTAVIAGYQGNTHFISMTDVWRDRFSRFSGQVASAKRGMFRASEWVTSPRQNPDFLYSLWAAHRGRWPSIGYWFIDLLIYLFKPKSSLGWSSCFKALRECAWIIEGEEEEKLQLQFCFF